MVKNNNLPWKHVVFYGCRFVDSTKTFCVFQFATRYLLYSAKKNMHDEKSNLGPKIVGRKRTLLNLHFTFVS